MNRLLSLFIVLGISLTSTNGSSEAAPLKVFVLVGQSNMQGHAQVRTFEHIGMDPQTAPILKEMQSPDGTPRICDDVWISYLSSNGVRSGKLTAGFGADENKIGPEFTFGLYMQQMLGEPILIIKAAWGGKSLHTDFRSPSAGPSEFSDEQIENLKKRDKDVEQAKADRKKATGHYFRLTVDHVREVLSNIKRVYPSYDAEQGHELAGLVWFQGWNDMVDRGVYPNRDQSGGYDQYSECMAHFIRDIRRELSAPKLPVVIGVMGVGGPVSKYQADQQRYKAVHQNFRDAMAAPAELPEFNGNVVAVRTENAWDMELTDLRRREAKVKQNIKEAQKAGKLTREKARSAEEQALAEEFTPAERDILSKGVSNAEYHYLGSAKIMAQIGKAFAEAMPRE